MLGLVEGLWETLLVCVAGLGGCLPQNSSVSSSDDISPSVGIVDSKAVPMISASVAPPPAIPVGGQLRSYHDHVLLTLRDSSMLTSFESVVLRRRDKECWDDQA